MALGRVKQKDWYKVLGALPSDSPAELKRKYQKLALLMLVNFNKWMGVIDHSLFDKMSSFCYLILCKFMVHTQQNGHQAIEMGDLASMCLAFDAICALQRNLMHLLSTLCPGYVSY
ncbi:hypothetical protein DV515_00015008 [Chloebia gouldiae]|uniref:J domain-containing protein n=1 Tax=Chloebia gouldiae TaxID=44316 RepID=A0A3L8RXP4_CHLGU|nr:hypothetical protein DV515_00015008 [Chloebia gouldiae]